MFRMMKVVFMKLCLEIIFGHSKSHPLISLRDVTPLRLLFNFEPVFVFVLLRHVHNASKVYHISFHIWPARGAPSCH